MRIEELHLKNFRCFKELDIQFPKSNLAVFIGLNGSGKTAILDAIHILLSHYQEKDKLFYTFDDVFVGEKYTENQINFYFEDEIKIWINNNNFQEKNQTILLNKIRYNEDDKSGFFCVYYKTSKQQNFIIKNIACSTSFNKFDNWFKEKVDFENEIKLENNINFSMPELDVVRTAIEKFLSYVTGAEFSNLRVKRNLNNRMSSYEDEIEALRNFDLYITYKGKDLKKSQLSEGQKLLINIVGDIAYHLASYYKFDVELFELSKEHFRIDKSEVKKLLEMKGVVLIDEIELHLHPQWQREVLPALQKTFPNIQFIVTTHSPQVLSNLKKEEVFILKDNKISEFKPYVEGRDSNSILSEIFGVSERPKIYQEKLNEVYKAIDNQKLKEAKELLKNLEKYWGASDTEILRADLHLSFAEE